MTLKHHILTESNFIVPTWEKGLANAVITIPGHEFPALPAVNMPPVSEHALVWVLSSVPHWQQWVRHYSDTCHVIVMSKVTSLPEMQQALQAGARGYMEVLANPQQLQQAAATVSMGALWMAAAMLSKLTGIIAGALPEPSPQTAVFDQLSKREREVAELVVTGVSNKDVAEQLNITVRTVKEHLSSIFQKLEINDRLQLILIARENPRLPVQSSAGNQGYVHKA